MNPPCAPFSAPYHVDLTIDFDDMADDQRRLDAENWCRHSTKHRWFRRILTRYGVARFEFDDDKEALMFHLRWR